MIVYLCIGFSVLLVGVCVYVAIGSMRTHSLRGGKQNKVVDHLGDAWEASRQEVTVDTYKRMKLLDEKANKRNKQREE